MVQICRLENIEYKNMKQVSYSGKSMVTCLTNILKIFQESDLKICPTLVLGTYAMYVFALRVK